MAVENQDPVELSNQEKETGAAYQITNANRAEIRAKLARLNQPDSLETSEDEALTGVSVSM